MTRPYGIAYCRVSTGAQAGADPWDSLPRQRKALTDTAKARGIDLLDIIEETVSGAKDKRPAFDAMMARVEAGEVQFVLVVDQTRLTRTEKLGELEAIVSRFKKGKCSLVTPYQVNSFQSVDEVLSFDYAAVGSKGERLRIFARTNNAKEEGAKAGRDMGGRVPFGYHRTFHPETGAPIYEPHPDEAPIVVEIFTLYAAGDTFRGIARLFNERGLKTKLGANWQADSIRFILMQPKYQGVSEYRKTARMRANYVAVGPAIVAASVAYPALVPEELAQAVDQALKRRTMGPGKHSPARWPLSGILTCPGCSKGLSRVSVKPERAHLGGYYRCQSYAPGRGVCPGRDFYQVRAAHIAVLAWIRDKLPTVQAERQAEARREARRKPRAHPEVKTIRRQLAELDDERRGVLRLVGSESMDDRAAASEFSRIARETEKLNTRLGELERVAEVVKAISKPMPDLGPIVALLDPLDHPTLRRLFAGMFRRVTLERDGWGTYQGKKAMLLRVTSVELHED